MKNTEYNAIESLEEAWVEGKLPIIQGIIKRYGLYYQVDNYDDSVIVVNPIPFLFDFSGDYFSHIAVLFEMKFEEYTLYSGEGSWGGDGFIYIEHTVTKKLLWCIFDDRINPIIKCKISDKKIIAENNNGCQYIFELENPEKLKYLAGI
jgi:hypothetical protein